MCLSDAAAEMMSSFFGRSCLSRGVALSGPLFDPRLHHAVLQGILDCMAHHVMWCFSSHERRQGSSIRLKEENMTASNCCWLSSLPLVLCLPLLALRWTAPQLHPQQEPPAFREQEERQKSFFQIEYCPATFKAKQLHHQASVCITRIQSSWMSSATVSHWSARAPITDSSWCRMNAWILTGAKKYEHTTRLMYLFHLDFIDTLRSSLRLVDVRPVGPTCLTSAFHSAAPWSFLRGGHVFAC